MSDPFKNALRNTIKQMRSNLSFALCAKLSKQVCKRIRALEHYRKAKTVGLYYAVNGEIDLSYLWDSAPLQGKFCYFPVLQEDRTLLFLPATPATAFKINRFGVSEPDVSADLALPVEQLDLILMPLLAFDSRGTRIGMGAGYYDRTLEHKNPGLLVGVGYSFQHVSYIEPQPWDISLDAVITPESIYWI